MKLDIPGAAPKPRDGVYTALTGQLRFVVRKFGAIDTHILQQEFAIIEDDGKGNRKQYFQWRDVPTETEGTQTPQ